MSMYFKQLRKEIQAINPIHFGRWIAEVNCGFWVKVLLMGSNISNGFWYFLKTKVGAFCESRNSRLIGS